MKCSSRKRKQIRNPIEENLWKFCEINGFSENLSLKQFHLWVDKNSEISRYIEKYGRYEAGSKNESVQNGVLLP